MPDPVPAKQYTAHELATLLGITPRTLHAWVAEGLVPKPPFHGRATRYTEDHLLRARAVSALRAKRVAVEEILRRVRGADAATLRALAGEPPPVAPPAPTPAAPLVPPAYPHERWQRVVLLPGLELHVREDASSALRRVADEIWRHFGAAASPSAPS